MLNFHLHRINIWTVVHPVAITSFESCEIRKGHSVDRFSSELLDMSLQPPLSIGVFFPRGLREKKLCSDCFLFISPLIASAT